VKVRGQGWLKWTRSGIGSVVLEDSRTGDDMGKRKLINK
jgi:hypothetical protein